MTYSRAMTCLMTYYDKKRTEAISIMLQAIFSINSNDHLFILNIILMGPNQYLSPQQLSLVILGCLYCVLSQPIFLRSYREVSSKATDLVVDTSTPINLYSTSDLKLHTFLMPGDKLYQVLIEIHSLEVFTTLKVNNPFQVYYTIIQYRGWGRF